MEISADDESELEFNCDTESDEDWQPKRSARVGNNDEDETSSARKQKVKRKGKKEHATISDDDSQIGDSDEGWSNQSPHGDDDDNDEQTPSTWSRNLFENFSVKQ